MNSLYIQQHRCPTSNAPSATPRAQRCATVRVACAAQLEKRYKSPSSSTASTELQYLESYTTVVPDTLLLQNIEEIEAPKAATVSSAVLAGILRTPGALQEYKVREATVYHLKANKGEGGALFAEFTSSCAACWSISGCTVLALQFGIENAINYDKCHNKSGDDRLACLLDKATVNIGTLFSKQVEGRVSTEVRTMGHAISSLVWRMHR